jgi:hypothetical protein
MSGMSFNEWEEAFKLIGLLGAVGMAWWRKGSEEEDKVVSEAAKELLEGISNADVVGKIQAETDLNLRDQITVEEAENWAKDRDLRGMRWRN